MRPTAEEGLMVTRSIKGWTLEGYTIWAFSPRSTVEWYSLKESVGLYGKGIHPLTGESHDLEIESGAPLLWTGHLSSPKWKNNQVDIWSLYWPGVFQTHRLGLEHKPEQDGWLAGFHYYDQTSMGNGGNEDALKAYVLPDHHAQVYSGQWGWVSKEGKKESEWTLNGTRIADGSPYVMPREWGRDPFFTFLARERNEGLADVWAMTAKWDYTHEHQEWIVALGNYRLPAWDDAARNKYQTPSYGQLYLEWADALTGFWEGVHLRAMLAYKWSTDTSLPDHVKVNTVNMLNASFIVDYHF